MDLLSLAKSCPGMSITIRLEDLLKANADLARSVREEVEAEAARRTAEFGDALVAKEEARVQLLGGVDPSTLWRWEKRGYLRPVRIGVKVFYRKGEIARLIGQKEINQTQ